MHHNKIVGRNKIEKLRQSRDVDMVLGEVPTKEIGKKLTLDRILTCEAKTQINHY